MKKTQHWFTFVELIIVVVILGILWTIGFVSYSGYLWGVRDGNRIAQIKDIQKTLQVYSTNKSLPLPDDSVEITASGATVGYQWYAGKNVLQQIQYTNGWVDPQDNTYFTYMISKNKKQFQVLTFLEEPGNLTKEPTTYLPWITQTYAADLSERFPKSLWAQLGVILQDTTNTPIQDIETGSVDIVTSGDDYHAVLSDTETLSGSGTLFTSLINNSSCEKIQQLWKSKGNSKYDINPDWSGDIEVYCDMETDGGGWTRVVYIERGDTTWNAYTTDNTVTNSAKKALFGMKINQFSADPNGEDLEYMFYVDGEQVWPIYTDLDGQFLDNTMWSWYFDNQFHYKSVNDSNFTLCNEGSGIRHADDRYNWSIASGNSWTQCNRHRFGWGLSAYSSPSGETFDRLSGLNTYDNNITWANLEIWIR